MSRRILVVEDSRTQAQRLRHLLEGQGYEVETAENGAVGLERIRAAPPHLIITDLNMPVMDGLALCQAVKSDPSTKRIPVIILTERRSPADIVDGLLHGADNFIPKPHSDAYLVGRIRRIFQMLELRNSESMDMEVALAFGERRFTITADKQQIMELLFSTVEELGETNTALRASQRNLRTAKEQAERANRAKSEFLSRMSHELRTPLNAIIGFGQLLEMEELTEPQIEAVSNILKAGRHLLDLINEVLDISRIEAGRLALSLEPVEVAPLVAAAVDLIRPLAEPRGITVRREGPEDLVVLADRQRLNQVMLNLLSNAVKYNREAGDVVVSWTADGERVLLSVRDTGPGIASDQVERLFQPFDRLGAEVTGVEGTGLGLTLTKGLIEAMHGTIGVSTHVGEGTTFTVALPLTHEGPRRHGSVNSPERSEAKVTGPRTVLYVEDNLSNAKLIEQVLARRPQVRLLTAMQGRLALDLAREHQPDLILLDLHLADMRGEEVLIRLRAEPETAGIPVVVISADATPGAERRLLARGAHAYLAKPIDVPQFLALIDRLFATRTE